MHFAGTWPLVKGAEVFKEVGEELGEFEIGQACALTAAADGLSGCDPGAESMDWEAYLDGT